MRGRGRPGPEDRSAGWFDDVRIYPRPTARPVMVRLRMGDEQLGEVAIPVQSLEGLYPDDVYDLIIE